MSVGFALLDTLKHKVFTSHFHLEKSDLEGRSEITLQFAIPKRTIVPGFYSFDAALFKAGAEGYEYLSDICHIEIVDSGHQMSYDTNFGSVLVDCKWDFI
ncbi:hypothetical protein ACQ86N_42680 [Puia sp. P3]|uniref:hypothetical protein n=1 Tax=Puia sp. P3 TaxID=3423952 RepID=UPI003D668989